MNDMAQAPSFRLDTVNQCLWRSGIAGADERLSLPPKAFHVLRYLADNPGRLITHGELLEALWRDVHVQPEVLKSHILAVRNALGDQAENPRFIETLRGRGYRFIGPIGTFSTSSRETTVVLDQSVIVGRAEPLDELLAQLDVALSGKPQVTFIVGESGIGKTALVDQFLTRTLSSELVVSRGQCLEGFAGTEPYYPVLQALGGLCSGPIGAAVGQALVTSAPTWALQMPGQISAEHRMALQRQFVEATRERMLREVCDLIELLATDRPIVLVFEDLQWADYATLDFLSAICRRRSRARFFLIATYRPENLDGGRHPLNEISRDLILRKLCSEIVLEPLTKKAVAEFLTGAADEQSASDEFAQLIREQSGGNPLFMRATLDHLTERGLVVQAMGGWRLRAHASEIKFEAPPTLARLIEARFERLTPEQQQALEAASATGLYFSAATSARAADLSPQIFEDSCEDLCRRSRFIDQDTMKVLPNNERVRRYRFKHTIYRQVLYDRQGPTRIARRHQAIAERLEEIYPPDQRDEWSLELAQHHAGARNWSRALFYLRAALRTANRRFAHRDALAILDHADALAASLPESTRIAAEIEFLERRAGILVVAHDPRAVDAHARLAKKAAQHGEINIQARSLLGLAHVAGWQDRARCLQILEEVLQLSARQDDLGLRAITRINVHIRRIWILGWSAEEARECEAAVTFLKAQGASPAAAQALIDFGMIGIVSTRYRDVYENLRANYRYLLEHTDHGAEPDVARAVWMHHVGVPWSLLFLGEFGEALAEFDAAIAAYESNGDRSEVLSLQIYRGLLLLQTKDFESVLDVCRPVALSTKERTNDPNSVRVLPVEQRMSLILCGLAEAGLGCRAAAVDYLLAAEREMENQPVILDWYWRLMLEWGVANLLIDAGDRAAAQARAARFVELAEQTEEWTWRALAWETQARAALDRGAATEAVECIRSALEAANGFETPLADWRVHETAAAAYQTLGKPRDAECHAQLGTAAKRRLAETLPEGHRLRMTFEDPGTTLFAVMPSR
jgi:DNA-binding winged helix-turn-helix (wHTH) protein/tetratricopeptide (TPR) repeat protein